jgi:vomeronasal1 receptor
MSSAGWDDITCKVFIFLHRFFRSFSVCATCLLIVFQAIILCPQSSRIAKFKHNCPQKHLYFFILLNIFYTSISSHIFIATIAPGNLTLVNLIYIYIMKTCSFVPMSSSMQHLLHTTGIFSLFSKMSCFWSHVPFNLLHGNSLVQA